jgi:large subunit ribosomal protein L16
MKQYPSKLKYKKNHRPSYSNLYLSEQKSFFLLKGFLAIKSIENGKLTFKQIEACRKSIRRVLRKEGNVFLRVFTNISVTKKPVSTRMGKGKGSHSMWISLIRKGQILCEVSEISMEILNRALKALKSASSKLPVRTRVVYSCY